MDEAKIELTNKELEKVAGGQGGAPDFYVITEACIQCGVCVGECNAEAISPKTFTIDADNCVGCGVCAEICPAGAIIPCK